MKQYLPNILNLFFLLIFVSAGNVSAQHSGTNSANKKEREKRIISEGWVELETEEQINPNTIFKKHKNIFGLGNDDLMQKVKTVTDEIGITHHRFQQYYKGIKVEGGGLIVHSNNDVAYRVNGKVASDLSIDITPTIIEEDALNIAITELKVVKEKSINTSAKLVIVCISPQFDFSSQNFVLAYKFYIESYWVYIDAHKGTVIKKASSIQFCASGTFVPSYSIYGSSRTFNTKFRGGFFQDFVLEDDCRGGGIHTQLCTASNAQTGECTSSNEVDDGDNQWSLESERPMTTTHWAMQRTFDYYKNTFSRSSFDNNNQEIRCFSKNNAGGSFNAFYRPAGTDDDASDDDFNFGSANGSDGYNSLDVVGHEFTHGVIKFEANLDGTGGEPSALGESFGDIFGEMVELFALGTNDWVHRQEITGVASTPRSLINPKAGNRPNTYLGEFWASSGFHDQGSVQNFWFYILSTGGSGFVDDNSNNEPYNVSGIGTSSAAAIAYRTIQFYLTSTSGFASAKTGSIFAAMDLYGACSNEVAQTVNAWKAVGVTGGYFENKTITGNFYFPSSCSGFWTVPSDCQKMRCSLVNNGFYYNQTINVLTSDCDITGINNFYPQTLHEPVVFVAGEKISLLPGFRSGRNFSAKLNPCLAQVNRTSNPNAFDNSETDANEITIENQQLIEEYNQKQNLNQLDNNQFHLYPNPTSGTLQMDYRLQENETGELIIYDITGRKVKRFLLTNQNNTLKIQEPELKNGVYLYQIIVNNEMRVSEKLVVIK